MPEKGSGSLVYREADDINETHANMFHIAPSGELVALYFGEQQFSLNADGNSELQEVLYDTKVKLTLESARELHDLLDEILYAEEPEEGTSPGVQ